MPPPVCTKYHIPIHYTIRFSQTTQVFLLWDVPFEWTGDMWFTFNCYCHLATLVVRGVGGSGHFLHRKEGVTQGESLAIIKYGIGILPLICELQDAHTQVPQTWYKNYAGAGGTFSALKIHMQDLMVQGPPWGIPLRWSISYWSSQIGMSRGKTHTSAGWDWRWSPEAATSLASLATRRQIPCDK